MFKAALEQPQVSVLYIALTNSSAEGVMYKDILKKINKQYACKATFTEKPLRIKFPNGSIIYLVGADTKGVFDRLLGQKYKLVVIDECKSYKQDLKTLVEEVLTPAVSDYQGTIVMIGTPGSNSKGYFYETTRQDDRSKRTKGWSVHEWTEDQNPHNRPYRKALLKDRLESNPFYNETLEYRQEWLGLWQQDESKLCYKFNPERNIVSSFDSSIEHWHYVMGVDLGWNDDSAFVIAAYNDHLPNLYIIETYKQKHLTLSEVAERIRFYQTKYDVERVIIDGAMKQGIEDMKQRYGLNLESADKKGKETFIDLMSSDLIQGRIVLVKGNTEALVNEWLHLTWDEKSDKRVELSTSPNHLADAALYCWRRCYHYQAEPLPTKPTNNDPNKDFWDKKLEELERKQQEFNFYGFDPNE